MAKKNVAKKQSPKGLLPQHFGGELILPQLSAW